MPHIHKLYDFTVSAFILHPTDNKICLHLHKKYRTWMQPGGHVELDENPEQALWRELKEELGFEKTDVKILGAQEQPHPRNAVTHPLPFHYFTHRFPDGHQHIDSTFLMRAHKTDFSPADGESNKIEWLDIDKIRELYEKNEVVENILDICEWIFLKKV